MMPPARKLWAPRREQKEKAAYAASIYDHDLV